MKTYKQVMMDTEGRCEEILNRDAYVAIAVEDGDSWYRDDEYGDYRGHTLITAATLYELMIKMAKSYTYPTGGVNSEKVYIWHGGELYGQAERELDYERDEYTGDWGVVELDTGSAANIDFRSAALEALATYCELDDYGLAGEVKSEVTEEDRETYPRLAESDFESDLIVLAC